MTRQRLFFTWLALALCLACSRGDAQKGGNANLQAQEANDATDDPDAQNPIVVEVSPVTLGDVSETIFATGTLTSQKQITLLAEASGVVADLKPVEGDLVEPAGQIIGKIHNPDLDLSIRTAQNQIRRLEAELARLKPLLDKGYIPRAEYDRSATELEIAQDELSRARTAAQSMTLRAPMRGVVSQRHVEVGTQISPGQPLLTFVDTDALEARLQIPEYELGKLRPQMPATISSQALGQPPFPAEVFALSPVVDPTSGTIRVTVRPTQVSRNDGLRLRPGMFTQVHITTQARQGVLLIPRRALLFDDTRPYVFVMRDNTARRTSVQTGTPKDDLIEVTQGLQPGDLIVTLGQAALRDGAPIRRTTPPTNPTDADVSSDTSNDKSLNTPD